MRAGGPLCPHGLSSPSVQVLAWPKPATPSLGLSQASLLRQSRFLAHSVICQSHLGHPFLAQQTGKIKTEKTKQNKTESMNFSFPFKGQLCLLGVMTCRRFCAQFSKNMYRQV